MGNIVILNLEDEPEVRDAIERDLAPFEGHFQIEAAEDVKEAEEVIAAVNQAGSKVGLILCDHRLPGESGVDFLTRLEAVPGSKKIRKVLITGQADQADTIKAINYAGLDHYIAKPWQVEELHVVVKEQLTEYVLQNEDDLLPYVEILDGERLMIALASRLSDA